MNHCFPQLLKLAHPVSDCPVIARAKPDVTISCISPSYKAAISLMAAFSSKSAKLQLFQINIDIFCHALIMKTEGGILL